MLHPRCLPVARVFLYFNEKYFQKKAPRIVEVVIFATDLKQQATTTMATLTNNPNAMNNQAWAAKAAAYAAAKR